MNKLTSLSLCALLTPAITLGVGAALAQEPGTSPQGAQTQQRASPAVPENERAQQSTDSEAAQTRHADQNTPIQSKPAGAISAKDLTGSALMSPQDENFGPIDDFIMNQDGQVLAVIVGVGGFLGIGERDVAIAWDSLDHSVDENGDVTFRVEMTDAALRAAPAYSQESSTNPQGAQTQQRTTPAVPGSERAQQREGAEPAQRRGETESAQVQHADRNTSIQSKPAGAISANDLTGSALMSRQDQNFGPINDFIMTRDGQVLAVIVGVGGFLGIGERDVAIAWDSLEHRADEDGDMVFHADLTDAALRAVPAYRND